MLFDAQNMVHVCMHSFLCFRLFSTAMGFEVEEVHKEVLLAYFSNPGIQVQVPEVLLNSEMRCE